LKRVALIYLKIIQTWAVLSTVHDGQPEESNKKVWLIALLVNSAIESVNKLEEKHGKPRYVGNKR